MNTFRRKYLYILIGCASFANAASGQGTTLPATAKIQHVNNKNKSVMNDKSFTTTFLVDQTPEQVFNAVTNVRGWWSENLQGASAKLNDEFTYSYKDVHMAKMRLIEVVPGKRVVWLVLDNHFKFTKDKTEWIDNKVTFDISKEGNQTRLVFTQHGLVPAYECFDICRDAWTHYVKDSLYDLITKGKGQPNSKEDAFNDELLEQHQK